MEMNYGNFKGETFEGLNGTITGSNFTDCIFTNSSDDLVFEKCNINNCRFDKPCKFVKSVIIGISIYSEAQPLVAKAATAASLEDKIAEKIQLLKDRDAAAAIIEASSFDSCNYVSTGTNIPAYKFAELKNNICLDNPLTTGGYVMTGPLGIARGDLDENGELETLDPNYANCLVETGMHAMPNPGAVAPYIITTYEMLKKDGIGKKISVNLTNIIDSTARNIMSNAGIEIKKYTFTISNISYLENDERVMIVDLENPNETVKFQYIVDMRQFGGIALRFNTPFKELEAIANSYYNVLRDIKKNGTVVGSFITEEDINNG